MSETKEFQPGDDVQLYARTFPELLMNGMTFTVTGPAQLTAAYDTKTRKLVAAIGYPVTTPEGREYVIPARDLLIMPRRRDLDTIVSWKDCPWVPKEYRA